MPRKRKINETADKELMPPPQRPVSKKQKLTKKQPSAHNNSSISSAHNVSNVSMNQSNHPSQHMSGPLFMIFEKAQTSESLHIKYFKELTQIYERVSVI